MDDKKTKELTIRSSAAEYLTFVASTGESDASFEMRYEDENIWLTQKMMAALYDVSVAAINQHLKRIFEDGELREEAVVKKYLITASDGKNYNTNHYNLQAIISVGFSGLCSSANGRDRSSKTILFKVGQWMLTG